MAAPAKRRQMEVKHPGAQKTQEPQYYSRAVAKALDLLEILGNSRQPLALHELAARVSLTKASAFRLLFTLESTGYVRKDQAARYTLKHEIRRSVRDKLIKTLLEAAAPFLRELTREFRETTGLAALFENHIEVIAVVESPQAIRMGNTVGRILQPHASSLGKCITAWQPEERREHLLRSYGIGPMTEHTITDEQELYREFERIRERGYGADAQETCMEGFCYGAPIFSPEAEAFAAISMSLPKTRLGDAEHQKRIIQTVKRAAAGISGSLRSSP
ncbi:MAG: IclR family transcriptional regulator [Bryobacteraceae bacterium]